MTDIPILYRTVLQVSDMDLAVRFYTKLLGTKDGAFAAADIISIAAR